MKKILKVIILFLILTAFYGNAFSNEDFNFYPKFNSISSYNKLTKKENPALNKPVKKKDFSFTINPYLWTVATSGTVGVPGIPSEYPKTYDFNQSFSDALSNLKFAFMIGGKIKYKQLSLYYDISYANQKAFDAEISDASLVSADVSSEEFITDLSLAYTIPMKSKSTILDVYAGTRIYGLKNEVTLTPQNQNLSSVMRSKSSNWIDPIVGINSYFVLSKNWFSYLRSDFGGFGVNSKWSFMILGGFGYEFNPNWNTSLGLKSLNVNYDKEESVWDVHQYGFIISFGYKY